jgi:hypothetical protein
MKKLLRMRCLAFLAFIAFCSVATAQVPSGFPAMPNTGNPAADAEAYEQAKQVWIQNNPSAPVNGGGNAASGIGVSVEAQNAAYEAAKVQASNNSVAGMPADEKAARELRQLEADFNLHQAEWAASNGRLLQAYIEAFTMARGQTSVSITAQEFASFHQELQNLITANPALFTVTQ